MFTGLITDVGTIDRVQTTDAGREFRIRTSYPDLSAGESIAVSGACLTVRELGEGWFTVADARPHDDGRLGGRPSREPRARARRG